MVPALFSCSPGSPIKHKNPVRSVALTVAHRNAAAPDKWSGAVDALCPAHLAMRS